MKKSMLKFCALVVCFAFIVTSCDPKEKEPEYLSQEESVASVTDVLDQALLSIDPQDQKDLVMTLYSLPGIPDTLLDIMFAQQLRLATQQSQISPISILLMSMTVMDILYETDIEDLYAEYSYNQETEEWTITPSTSILKLKYPVIDPANSTNIKEGVISISNMPVEKTNEDTIPYKKIKVEITNDSKIVLSADLLLKIGFSGSDENSYPNYDIEMSMDLSGYVVDFGLFINEDGLGVLVGLEVDDVEIIKLDANMDGRGLYSIIAEEDEIAPTSTSAKLSVMNKLVIDIAAPKTELLISEYRQLINMDMAKEAELKETSTMLNKYVESNIAIDGVDFAKFKSDVALDGDTCLYIGLSFYKDNTFTPLTEYVDNEDFAGVVYYFLKLEKGFQSLFESLFE